MMRTVFLLLALLTQHLTCCSQKQLELEQYYFVKNSRYTIMPVLHLQNDHNWYAEARYNYDELKTFSMYFGKTFSNHTDFKYHFTPMMGGSIGALQSISAGLNIELEYRKFTFSSQMQYTRATVEDEKSFYYNWSEITCQPLSWLYAGLSAQQTAMYLNQCDFETGVVVALTFRNYTIPLYAFSPLKSKRYVMLGVNIRLQRLQENK